MNGYQRVRAALEGVKPDKTPIMLHNFMMAVKEAGFTMEDYRNSPQIIAQCFIQAIEKYEYDGILVDLDTVTLAGACGVHVDFPIHEPARSHHGFITSLADIPSLPSINIENYRYVGVWCEAVRILKDYFKDELFIRGNCDQAPFSLATMLRGPENLMMDLCIEKEDVIFELLDYCSIATKQLLRLMKDAGADMLSNGDSPAGPAMLSPTMYKQFAVPYEKKIADYSHELGLPYMLHICGKTDLILDLMLEVGADALELDYKTDILLAEQKFRGNTVFAGNIDPSGVLALGTPELVEKKTAELLQIFEDNPRFILNAGCAIPSNTPTENLKAMINTARQYN